MKRRYMAAGAALLMLSAWVAWEGADGADGGHPADPVDAPFAAPTPPAAREATVGALPTLSAVLGALPGESPVPGWASLAEARERGDSRAPPLYRPGVADGAPNAAQLADPVAYQAYERSRQARTLAAFAAAARTKTAQLRADVAQARAAGIAPAEIVKVERKIHRLEEIGRAIAEQGTMPPD